MTNKKINLNTDFLDEDDGIKGKPKDGYTKKHSGSSKSEDGKEFTYNRSSDDTKETEKYTAKSCSEELASLKDTKKTYGFGHVFGGLVILVVVIALFGGFDDKPKPVTTSSNFNIDTEKIDFSTKDSKKTTTTSNSPSNSNEDEVITGQFSCSTYNHNEAGRLSPSTVKKSELDTKEAELNSMDSGIDKIEAEIDSFKLNESSQSSVNTYNKKIETYNSLVNKRKTKYTEYKKLLDSYNASVDKYNSFLEKNCTRRY